MRHVDTRAKKINYPRKRPLQSALLLPSHVADSSPLHSDFSELSGRSKELNLQVLDDGKPLESELMADAVISVGRLFFSSDSMSFVVIFYRTCKLQMHIYKMYFSVYGCRRFIGGRGFGAL